MIRATILIAVTFVVLLVTTRCTSAQPIDAQKEGRPLFTEGQPGRLELTLPTDRLAETLSVLAEVNLSPQFDLTIGQKERIQAVRHRVKQAEEAWREQNAAEIEAYLREERETLRERTSFREHTPTEANNKRYGDMLRRRWALLTSSPKTDDAADEIKAILTLEQARMFEQTVQEREQELPEWQRNLRQRLRERGRGLR